MDNADDAKGLTSLHEPRRAPLASLGYFLASSQLGATRWGVHPLGDRRASEEKDSKRALVAALGDGAPRAATLTLDPTICPRSFATGPSADVFTLLLAPTGVRRHARRGL